MLCRLDYLYIYAYAYLCICVPYVMGNLKTLGPSIKYVTLFLANFDPSPVTLCHTSRDSTKYVTHLGSPDFYYRPSIQKAGQNPSVQILSQLFAGVFVRGLLSGGLLYGGFCREWFLSVPPSVRIHL